MAEVADQVIVELIAKNDNFDATIKSSANAYTSSVGQIATAADGAEKAHGRMTLSMNQSRIGMLEFQHVARGMSDQIAAGAPLTQILTTHIGELGEAVTLTGGAFGGFASFLGGPWGLALTAAISGVALLISKHHEEGDTLEATIEKLKKHHDQTLLNEQADREWGNTIEGVIENLDKLAEATSRKQELPNVANRQAYDDAKTTVDAINKLITQVEADPLSTTAQVQGLYDELAAAMRNLRQQTIAVGTQAGDVFSDLTKRANDWAEGLQNKVRYITGAHPELASSTGQIDTALDALKKASTDAAAANVPFDKVITQVDALNQKLEDSPSFIKDYIAQLKALAAQLEATAAAAKNGPKAITDFQRDVIGAEGTGRNRLGSSASGIGQFMPGTFEDYFKRLYPQQAAGLTDAAIDDLRNNKTVAMAVISAATQDYIKVLQAAGQQITEASLYTVHLLGAKDARSFFAASPGESVSSALLAGGASQRHVSSVLAGNPFLRGTVGDAQSAISQRIGDSSSAISAGAVDLAKEQADAWQRVVELAGKLDVEDGKINLLKDGALADDRASVSYLDRQTVLLTLAQHGLEGWEKQYQQIIASQKELNRFGEQMIDDVLNPDNWTSFGDIAKKVLKDIEIELITLAAINPLKNLLFHQNNPTFGSVLSSLFGGGHGAPTPAPDAGGIIVDGFASGGSVSGPGSSTSDSVPAMLSAGEFVLQASAVRRIGVENLNALNEGRNKHFSSGGLVTPSNAIAASPYGSIMPGHVLVEIEASEYFDGRVVKVAGPVVARASVAAANGGASIARRNLAREAQHRLD